MAVLATVGVIDTGSITLSRWGLLGNLTCPIGADGCDKVLNSAWGTVFAGIPLSLVGVLAYGAVLLMALEERREWRRDKRPPTNSQEPAPLRRSQAEIKWLGLSQHVFCVVLHIFWIFFIYN